MPCASFADLRAANPFVNLRERRDLKFLATKIMTKRSCLHSKKKIMVSSMVYGLKMRERAKVSACLLNEREEREKKIRMRYSGRYRLSG
jgi:hypothetical protein